MIAVFGATGNTGRATVKELQALGEDPLCVIRDAEKAKTFYGGVIGWNFEAMQMPDGTYWVAKMDDKAVGGLFPLTSPQFDGVPESWATRMSSGGAPPGKSASISAWA